MGRELNTPAGAIIADTHDEEPACEDFKQVWSVWASREEDEENQSDESRCVNMGVGIGR